MAQIDLRRATIRISDGGSNHIDISIGEGSFDYNEKRELDNVKNRGVLDTVRENEDVPVEISTIFIWEFISGTGSEPATVEDALKKVGQASGWTTVASDPDEPYCVNVSVIYVPLCSGVPTETILFRRFHYQELAHSLKDATVALRGFANVKKAEVTRS